MKFTLAFVTFITAVLAAPTPESKLRRTRTGKAKADSYIVKLKDTVSVTTAVQELNDLAFAFSDVDSFKEVTYSDWSVLNGYAAVLKGAALDHVLADPNVEYVEEDGIVSIKWDSANDLPERDVAPEELHELSKRQTGAGTRFYAVDTGIRATHSSFSGRATFGAVFGGYAARDGNGHGTHTAGSAAGVGFGPATSATIIGVKVLSDSGSGSFSDIISGINWSVTDAGSRPAVINLSLGGGASSSVDNAVSNAISRGIHVTIAAGNSNVNAANTSPARVAAAITVGAIDSSRRKASFSNYGSILDCWYLGVSVRSAWYTSDTAANTISGTSMAAPGVAGLVLAHISRNGNASPATIVSRLTAAAVSDVSGAPSGTTTRRCVAF